MCHPEPIWGGAGEDIRPVQRVSIAAGDEQIPAFLSRPEGDAPAPAILIISDVYGASPFYQEMAGRLAHEGYLALLPDLFHRVGGLPEQTIEAARERAGKLKEPGTLADLRAALHFLQARKDVEPKQVGTIGFCLGGTLGMLTARQALGVGAACVFYGFPVNARGTSPIDQAEAIDVPMLGFWGDQDTGVGMENVRRLEQELERLNKDYQIVIYPGAGHGFMARRTPGDGPAAEDAWPKALQFLDARLRVGSVAASD